MAGKNDGDIRDAVEVMLKNQKEIREAMEDPVQQRFVDVWMAETRLTLFSIGESADYAKVIPMLQGIVEADDCIRHRDALIDALAQKSCLDLAKKDQGFANLLESCRRFQTGKEILTLALTSETLAPVVLGDAEAKECLQVVLKSDDQFPSFRRPADLVLIKHLAPERSAEAQAEYESNRHYKQEVVLTSHLSPFDPDVTVAEYFILLAEGKDAEAKALFEKARAEGRQVDHRCLPGSASPTHRRT